MKQNIWRKLAKPIFILAPMDDVTDTVFRRIVAKVGKPDLFFTEFTNVDGLQSAGRDKVMNRLKFTKSEKPIIAQIWGLNPDNFYQSAKDIVEMGFDGIDLNMGCPEPGTIKKGACSALIKNPELAAKIISETKRGAGDLPVSVKTRIGFGKIETEEWCGFILKQNISALIVHGRTVREMSKVPAHWNEIAKVVKLRDEMGIDTVIVGNGDVENREDGLKKVAQTGVDGIMIGRGIFHDIFAFNDSPHPSLLPEGEGIIQEQNEGQSIPRPLGEGRGEGITERTLPQMLDLLLDHSRLFEKEWGRTKHFAILRKFFKIYVSYFPHASELRAQLMQTNNIEEVEKIVAQYLEAQNKIAASVVPPSSQ